MLNEQFGMSFVSWSSSLSHAFLNFFQFGFSTFTDKLESGSENKVI